MHTRLNLSDINYDTVFVMRIIIILLEREVFFGHLLYHVADGVYPIKVDDKTLFKSPNYQVPRIRHDYHLAGSLSAFFLDRRLESKKKLFYLGWLSQSDVLSCQPVSLSVIVFGSSLFF